MVAAQQIAPGDGQERAAAERQEVSLHEALATCGTMYFELIGEITKIETIATGRSTRDLNRLRKRYGSSRWRKLKGVASVRITGGAIRRVEVH